MTKDIRERFWERFELGELNEDEWEAICDGCGCCCVLKFEDEDSSEFIYTSVACRLLDSSTCRCKDYSRRTEVVPSCIKLLPQNIESNLEFMPKTCAYRLLYEGRPLFEWHPLISGDPDSVHKAGISISGRHISEEHVADEDLRNFAVEDY
ncbi:MAG: YcgN family cysteine cluster protein [Albidovulum sp.]|nr:YcgN family cysteine cluster protein [Albidovulum sp.]MDE0534376.1 YcgN family cysteine cluster protein [Albidovulum sp.]